MPCETRKKILENESHYYTLLQKQNTPPKMQLRPLLTNPSLDQLDCCLGSLKKIYITFSLQKMPSQLSKPKTDSLKIIFAYREAIGWNELPNHVRDSEKLNKFKVYLRDHHDN